MVAGLVMLVVAAWASPAAAHAALQSTEPGSGAALAAPPKQVVLRFTKAVAAAADAISIVDAAGLSLSTGPAVQPPGEGTVVALDLPVLQPGSYLVTWKASGGDSHPLKGSFSFQVVAPGGEDTTPASSGAGAATTGVPTWAGVADDNDSPAVKTLFTVSRFAAFASLALIVGGVAFVVLVWPGGAGQKRFRRLMASAWAAAVTCTVVAIGLQRAYATGLSLGDAFRPSAFSPVFDTRFGQMSMARLVLLVLAVPFWRRLRSSLPAAGGPVPAFVAAPLGLLGVGVLLTLGLSGHSAVGDLVAVAVTADLLHTAGVSLWLGGLAVLAVCALPRGDAEELAAVVPRFSKVAFASVGVILVTGSFQAWRQVGSVDALASTGYGRFLLVKLALFTGMVALGALSRSWVRRRYAVPVLAMASGPGANLAEMPAATVARLRRSVGAEVVIAVAILSVTAMLVNTAPARMGLPAPDRPASTRGPAAG